MRAYFPILGWVTLIANGVGVVVLNDMPATYRIDALSDWSEQLLAQPGAAQVSAWGFAIGVLALGALCRAMARALQRAEAALASDLILVGAVINATLALIPATFAQPLGNSDALHALLALAVHGDAFFNGLLGLGLLILGQALVSSQPVLRRLGRFGQVAGALSLLVTAQAFDGRAASLVMVAGPLWLVWSVWAGHAMSRIEQRT